MFAESSSIEVGDRQPDRIGMGPIDIYLRTDKAPRAYVHSLFAGVLVARTRSYESSWVTAQDLLAPAAPDPFWSEWRVRLPGSRTRHSLKKAASRVAARRPDESPE